MKKIITILLGILVVISIYFAVHKQNTGSITIGFIGSLTGVDPSFGKSMKDGVSMAVDEINKSGGIHGARVSVVYEDGQCLNGTLAASAAQKLIHIDHVKVIIGGGCSNEALAIKPIVESEGVLFISAGASNPKLTENNSGLIFRNSVNDAMTGETLATYVGAEYHNVAVISERTEYAEGLRNTFIKKSKKLGLTIVADEASAPSNDFRSLLSVIKTKNPEAIFLNGQSSKSVGLMAKQARELGIKSQFYVAYFDTQEFKDIAGNAALGTQVINTPQLISDKGNKYIAQYKDTFGSSPSYPYFSALAYDATKLVIGAMKEDYVEPKDIAIYLKNIASYDGIAGTYSFDSNGEMLGVQYVLSRISK